MSEDLSFENRVVEKTAGPCRLFILPTPVEDVVSWRGSFRALPDIEAGEEMLQELTVSLLDKGTRTRDRFALARVLEDRGAHLDLSSDGLRVGFSGQALREDVPAVLEALAEMLSTPAFDVEEVQKAKAQAAAQLQRRMENTGARANGALARHLYPPSHPNYAPRPELLLEQVQAAEREDIAHYHAAHFGADDFIIAFAGDVDPDAAATVVAEHFGDWAAHEAAPHHASDALPPEAGQSAVPMPDRENLDVRLGHGLPGVRRQDDDYIPLYLANYVLGGNFSARLMAEIRDARGLTYGIGAGLTGLGADYDGHWRINVTLSRERLDEGLAATRAEVERFVEDGITKEELEEKKTTATGSFKVGLSTTGRQARTLLVNAERGFDVGYLDRYPSKIEAVTLEAANRALRVHFHPEKLHVAQAGTLPDDELVTHAQA